MRFYNTLHKKKEEFKPLHGKAVGLYSCGPTVYNYAHIGNLRTYVFVDILKRALAANGYSVKHIMNITDVGHLTSDADSGEDKLEKGAAREKKTVWEVAEFYTAAFKRDIKALNILPPDAWSKATGHIKDQIDLIKKLENKGFIYEGAEAVYFDTMKFSGYGKMAGIEKQETKTGAGKRRGASVERDPEKKHPRDFVLWFKIAGKYKNHAMRWPSPWGRGFPGWHIECSAMSMKYLGDTLDIHTGGVDHIGTHHMNEIAQSEGATGKQFVRFWMHGEFLTVGGEGKMAKSGGNFITLSRLVKDSHDPLGLRYLFLTAHYRSKLNFSLEALSAAEEALRKIKDFFESSFFGEEEKKDESGVAEKLRNSFWEAVNDDLNTPRALAALWSVFKSPLSYETKKTIILEFDAILGFGLYKLKPVPVPVAIKKLLAEREFLRKNKRFANADELRKKIEKSGYKIEDTAGGAMVRK